MHIYRNDFHLLAEARQIQSRNKWEKRSPANKGKIGEKRKKIHFSWLFGSFISISLMSVFVCYLYFSLFFFFSCCSLAIRQPSQHTIFPNSFSIRCRKTILTFSTSFYLAAQKNKTNTCTRDEQENSKKNKKKKKMGEDLTLIYTWGNTHREFIFEKFCENEDSCKLWGKREDRRSKYKWKRIRKKSCASFFEAVCVNELNEWIVWRTLLLFQSK